MKNSATVVTDPGPGFLSCIRRRKRGVALVLVLAFLVIITALVIAFFTTVTTELSSAKGYEGEAVARQLGDSAVQNVMATITQATNHATGTAWASQPGMIWNYDATGAATSAYKLYSSDNMVATGGFTAISDVTDYWYNYPSVFTDLNSPVTTASGTLDFPIIDGNTMRSMTVDGSPALTYSTDGSTQDVAGFSVSAPSTKSQNTSGSSPATGNNPVPMPTRWLYVLKNGVLTATDAGTNEPATFTKAPTDRQPTSTNPIVGRIAYWTDDETCKININTASEGAMWDTPRGASNADQLLGLYQPANNEFQRYPGHPAMVSLSTVFPLLSANQIFAMTPRVVSGGSRQGTAVAINTLQKDSDRLYASVDELMFNSMRGGNPPADPNNPSNTDTFSFKRAQVEQKKFFLTARSVAPELNLFDLPRVACWPVHSFPNQSNFDPGTLSTSYTTPYDRLIATCASTGIGNASSPYSPYFFQRQDNLSSTTDIGIQRNQYLLSYLRTLTAKPVPGFGGNFVSKYGTDCQQILTEIFDYIRCTNLFDDNLIGQIPSGTPFTTVNAGQPKTYVAGHGFVAPSRTNAGGVQTMGFGRYYTIEQFGIAFICNAVARSSATSTVDDSYGSNDPSTNVVLASANAGKALNTGQKVIQGFIPMEFFTPMEGWTAIYPNMQVEVIGLDTLGITDTAQVYQNLGFAHDSLLTINSNPSSQNAGEAWGGQTNWRYTFLNQTKLSPLTNYPLIGKSITISAPNTYPTSTSTSDSIPKMGFTGGDITVKIFIPNNSSPANLVQTLTITLPSTSPTALFPIPNLVNSATPDSTASGGSATMPMQNWWSLTPYSGYSGMLGRLYYSNAGCWGQVSGVPVPSAGAVFRCNEFTASYAQVPDYFDVVRTVLPKHGDFRLVAGSNIVPNTAFGKHRYYDMPTYYAASNLSNSTATNVEQGNDVTGRYFSNVAPGFIGDLPSDVSRTAVPPQSPDTSGDVDSGLPNSTDGPFINKPDEGCAPNPTNANDLPYYTTYYVQTDPGPTFFSPNRIMISPGMFGSLPTGILANKPWQTLLFRRQDTHPQSNSANAHSPSDHLFMDLFWMPVVEPYAISDRFSTAGKINMNYQIAPFSYITRNTALRALLKNETLAAVVNANYPNFKSSTKQGSNTTGSNAMLSASDSTHPTIRLPIDVPGTLSQFQNGYFANGKLFKSASEICDQYIVPTSANVGTNPSLGTVNSLMASFWLNNVGTGDNLRERIYTTLYPRLTTKSNTFTVHFRAQALKQSPASVTAGTWSESKDTVAGDYRGSTVIERYLDPSDSTIPDYAPITDPTDSAIVKPLTSFYRWRVVENHRFAP